MNTKRTFCNIVVPSPLLYNDIAEEADIMEESAWRSKV